MPFILIKNGYQYTIMLKRVLYKNCKDYLEPHFGYLTFLSDKNGILTIDKQRESLKILRDFKKHCSHATLNVSKLDLKTHKSYEYNFAITSSAKPVTIIPTLSEAMLRETAKSYNVIEIAKDLYITSHSIDNKWTLKPEKLRYDEDEDRYIEVVTNKPFYITRKDLEKMSNIVIDRIESTNEPLEKIDITSKGDFINDIVSFKTLEEHKKGTFNNKNYQEIDKIYNEINDKYNKLESEFINSNKFTKLDEE